jgi:uncharacterized Rmd1/YagE family protein
VRSIVLQHGDNIMTKLALSLAVAQSVKLAWLEWLLDNTIERTKWIPHDVAKKGAVEMRKNDIYKSVGVLFNLVRLHRIKLIDYLSAWRFP